MGRMTRRTFALAVVAALLALNATLLLVQPGLALPGSLATYLLGPKMVKAEVVVKEGKTTYDYRIDQGKIRTVASTSVTLYERTGEVVTIPVSPGARVTLGGKTVLLTALKKGMRVQTVRNGSAPADIVQAFKR
jgi:hypothetical protein